MLNLQEKRDSALEEVGHRSMCAVLYCLIFRYMFVSCLFHMFMYFTVYCFYFLLGICELSLSDSNGNLFQYHFQYSVFSNNRFLKIMVISNNC